MHDVTLESVAAVTDHFADAFVRGNVARVYMTLWRRNEVRKFDAKITITHVCFIALTLAGSLGRYLNTRPDGLVFKQLPRDPANVNA